ncbi:hypothetical protein [Streptomyces sp. NPDC058382]
MAAVGATGFVGDNPAPPGAEANASAARTDAVILAAQTGAAGDDPGRHP